VNGATGEVRAAQIFVGVLGASSYTYAEATWTQSLPASHRSRCGGDGGGSAARHMVQFTLDRTLRRWQY
jgi:hypothetical protein